ncbi:MAG: flagellar basal body-associated protein FliL [Desulfovibrionales bacterium]
MPVRDEEVQEEQQQEPKKRGLFKWIVITVVLLLLAAGGYFGYATFIATGEENATDSGGENVTEPLQSRTVSLQPFVVNLADPLGRRYLKVSMDLELADEKSMQEATRAMPKIKDSLLLLLSSKSYSNLAKMEDKLRLKQEIVERVGHIIGQGKVVDIYFTEFVIQ